MNRLPMFHVVIHVLLSFPVLLVVDCSKIVNLCVCFWGKHVCCVWRHRLHYDLIQTFGYIQWWWMVAYHIQFADHWWHIIIVVVVIGSATCWSTIEFVILFNPNYQQKSIQMKTENETKKILFIYMYIYDVIVIISMGGNMGTEFQVEAFKSCLHHNINI